MNFISITSARPLIYQFWLHEGPVVTQDELIRNGTKLVSQDNPRNLTFRYIFDLDLTVIGWEKLPEDHLLVNNGYGLFLSKYAEDWAKRNDVEWTYRGQDDMNWIEINGEDAAMKFKLRWM